MISVELIPQSRSTWQPLLCVTLGLLAYRESAPTELSLYEGGGAAASPSVQVAVVLEGLKSPPFKPPKGAEFKFLSLKMVLLLALASAKRISDLHALSVYPS